MKFLSVCLALATLAVAVAQIQPLNRHTGVGFEQPGPPDVCLEGPYHKDVPSPEEEEFDECLSWQSEACCNVEVPRIIDQHKARGLYNYSWDLCGVLSQECETFIKDEECFYQCEPMLGHFEIDNTGYIAHVPVCSSYCDRWFEACRNDLTCVENWLDDFDYAENGNNTCPEGSKCMKFEQMYGNAEGLCNKMWGNAFFYSKDENNCTVMAFENAMGNPNYLMTFPSSHAPPCAVVSMVAVVLAALGSLLVV